MTGDAPLALTTRIEPSPLADAETTVSPLVSAEQAEQITRQAQIGTRRPGISLAAFPAFLYSFLPYTLTLQARLTEGTTLHRVLTLAWPSVMEQSLVTLMFWLRFRSGKWASLRV